AVDAVQAITPVTTSSDPLVRRAAVEALGMLTQRQVKLDAAVVDALSRALYDEDAIVVPVSGEVNDLRGVVQEAPSQVADLCGKTLVK
ncbi:MAG: HEAT repeat domain-containing protein, partial [candidate division Zixibacteria bacterium]|nr:HEAT repeat domain-containing protein [candidate division Zixibacteria bacterium]